MQVESFVSKDTDASQSHKLGTEEKELIQLSMVARVATSIGSEYGTDQDCGPIGYKLLNPTQQSLVSLTVDGLLRLKETADGELIGSHKIGFLVYLPDLDPHAIYTWPVDFIFNLEIRPKDDLTKTIAESLMRQAPILVD